MKKIVASSSQNDEPSPLLTGQQRQSVSSLKWAQKYLDRNSPLYRPILIANPEEYIDSKDQKNNIRIKNINFEEDVNEACAIARLNIGVLALEKITHPKIIYAFTETHTLILKEEMYISRRYAQCNKSDLFDLIEKKGIDVFPAKVCDQLIDMGTFTAEEFLSTLKSSPNKFDNLKEIAKEFVNLVEKKGWKNVSTTIRLQLRWKGIVDDDEVEKANRQYLANIFAEEGGKISSTANRFGGVFFHYEEAKPEDKKEDLVKSPQDNSVVKKETSPTITTAMPGLSSSK